MIDIKIETIEDLEKVEKIINKIQNLGNSIKRSNGAKTFKDFVDAMTKIYDEIDPHYFKNTYGDKVVISTLVRDSLDLTHSLVTAMEDFNNCITDITDEYSIT